MQFEIKIGISAGEIMRDDFPIIDSSLTLEDCIRKLDKKYESCIILHEGVVHSVLSYDDLLRAFLVRRKKNAKISEFEPTDNFTIVSPETDMFDVIKLMKKTGIDFVIVKDGHSIGLITKKEIVEVNQILFDKIASGSPEILLS